MMSGNAEQAERYFIRWRGHVEGPFDRARVKTLLAAGRISRHHQVSTDQRTWKPLSSLALDDAVPGVRVEPRPGFSLNAAPSGADAFERHEKSNGEPRLRLQVKQPDEDKREEPPDGDDGWFFLENDQVSGPVTTEDIRAMLHEGRLTTGSSVCRNGEETWQPVRSVEELIVFGKALDAPVSSAALDPYTTKPYPAFWRRGVAALVDMLIVGGFAGIMLLVLALTLAANNLPRADVFLILRVFGPILIIVANWAYSTCMESSASQGTAGKIAMGIFVASDQGLPVSFGQANVRYWSKLLSMILLMAGFFMAAFTERRQALHDMISGTCVLTRD